MTREPMPLLDVGLLRGRLWSGVRRAGPVQWASICIAIPGRPASDRHSAGRPCVKAAQAKPNGRLELPRRIKPGSELVRTWNRRTYRVVVMEKGVCPGRGRPFPASPKSPLRSPAPSGMARDAAHPATAPDGGLASRPNPWHHVCIASDHDEQEERDRTANLLLSAKIPK